MDLILCADCLAGLDHCHGTLINHRDGSAECTHQACASPEPLRHALRIDCTEIDGGCGCDRDCGCGCGCANEPEDIRSALDLLAAS